MIASPHDIEALARALDRAGEGVLIPGRLRGSVMLAGQSELLDALPLGGALVLAVVGAGEEIVAAPLRWNDGGVARAEPGDGAFSGILRFIGDAGSTGRFLGRAYGEVPAGESERVVEADQSNDSVVVGERVVVKVYLRTVSGAQPGMDLPAHLREVGFTETPQAYGASTWGTGEHQALLATASEYLPGARDGWGWYVELVEGWLSGDDVDPVFPAGEMGGLVARLHASLATPSGVLPDPVREAEEEDVEGWRARALATLDEALTVTGGAEGDRLRALAARARDLLEEMRASPGSRLMRIHGDLHVGQILQWEGGLAVSDFDGNPLAPPNVRVAVDTPMRDVASMVRAIDHVGRVVQRRILGRDAEIGSWIADARGTFLDRYRSELRAAGQPFPFDDALLAPLEVAQECHEYVYAARYLPRWLYVPDLAMPALFASDFA